MFKFITVARQFYLSVRMVIDVFDDLLAYCKKISFAIVLIAFNAIEASFYAKPSCLVSFIFSVSYYYNNPKYVK